MKWKMQRIIKCESFNKYLNKIRLGLHAYYISRIFVSIYILYALKFYAKI